MMWCQPGCHSGKEQAAIPFAEEVMSAPEFSTWAASFSMACNIEEVLSAPAIMLATFILAFCGLSKLFEVESCGESSISVFIVVVSLILKAESVILKAVDCVHTNCKDFSD